MVVAVYVPFAVKGHLVDTPFGPAGPLRTENVAGRPIVFIARRGDPRARIVAVKERGAIHALGLGAAISLHPPSSALYLGDWLAPSDVIDQTRGTPTTFFTHTGLGYLSQSPPFCPETRDAVVNAVNFVTCHPSPAARHSLIAIAAPERTITPAEVKAWGLLGGHIAMPGLGPEWYLCRELEIGYAPLCCVCWSGGEAQPLTEDVARPIIEKVVAELPETHSWENSNTAARRELGDDWRRWIEGR